MCGIAVVYAQRERARVGVEELHQMISTMSYRGPDARGVCFPSPEVGLAHLRLAVVDLSAESNQPFVSDNGRYVITYNGEIYNHLELRAELAASGFQFRTKSDTEVLLAAYQLWGVDCVTRFNGMWAFAIFDRDTERLFCSRDRFGVKPLYFSQHSGRFLLASEIKAILAIAPDLAGPNFDSLSRFFRASFHSESSATFFAQVRQLEPAHNMFVTKSGLKIWRYWDYPSTSACLASEEATQDVRELLENAITLRLRSDVPVGTCLSGGLDSSAIACLLRTTYGGPHSTFTASFPGEQFDESPRATALAMSLGMVPRSIPIEPKDILPLLRKIVFHLDSPTQCPAVIPLWNIMGAMKGKIVVALDGQGADELFGGYIDRVFGHSVWDSLTRGRFIEAGLDVRQQVRTWGWRTAVVWSARDMFPGSHRWYRRFRGDESVYIGPLKGGPDDIPNPYRDLDAPDSVNRLLRFQHGGALRTLLQYGDALSMAHSIEVRMPYLDYRLVELGFQMPGSFKVRGAQGKVVLRNAVKDVVPPDILQIRRKLGFGTPMAQWLRTYSKDLIEPVLFTSTCRNRGLFDPVRLRNAVNRHVSGRADLSSQILRWITAELWFQRFID